MSPIHPKTEPEREPYFRSAFRPRLRILGGLIDGIPLFDTILLLGLFYVINSIFILRPGIALDLPQTPFAAGARYGDLVVTLSQENMVFFNDERTTIDGLQAAFLQAAHGNPEAVLVIEADGRVPHRTLVQVYNMAMSAGIRQVSLATGVAAAADETPAPPAP